MSRKRASVTKEGGEKKTSPILLKERRFQLERKEMGRWEKMEGGDVPFDHASLCLISTKDSILSLGVGDFTTGEYVRKPPTPDGIHESYKITRTR